MDATFMTALHIYNVRHLKDIVIPLSSEQRKALILTGKNGSGKTSVLMAMRDFMEYAVSQGFYSKNECESNARIHRTQLAKSPTTDAQKMGAEQNKHFLDLWERELSHWTDGAVGQFASYADLRSKYQAGEYILAYYSDHRKVDVLIPKNIEKVELKDSYPIKERPGQQLVKYLVNLKTTEAFAQSSGNIQRAQEIKVWFSNFEQVLRSIYDDDALKLDFNIDTFAFTIRQRNREPFNFNEMSMGYSAVFDIIGDLMMRMESKRRYDVEGLVMIDEVETHLHVELQKKIVPILMQLFPNIQFVLTTHSPFILNSTPNAIVYDLETGVLVEGGLDKLPYEGIIEGYFHADLLSDELRKKFDAYKSLVNKPELTDADFAAAAELELYLDEVPDYLALDFSAEYNRLKLMLSERG